MDLRERIEALNWTLSSRGWIDVIQPEIVSELKKLDEQWMSSVLSPSEEISLKERIRAFRWLLQWRDRLNVLTEQLTANEQLVSVMTEHRGEAGSPF